MLKTFGKGDTAELLEQGKEWMKIRFSEGGAKKTGYVYASYVKVTGDVQYGETLAEEKARIAAEKKAAEEAAKKAEASPMKILIYLSLLTAVFSALQNFSWQQS